MVGGASTTNVAEAVFPLPPFVEVTLELILFFVPAVVPVIDTVIVHVPPGTIVAPLTLTLPGAPVIEGDPHPAEVGAAATTSPDGNGSVNPTPTSVTVVFGFVILKVRVVFWFSGMVGAANDFVMAGGAITTRVAELLGLPVSAT
jgi:hypothetical protein